MRGKRLGLLGGLQWECRCSIETLSGSWVQLGPWRLWPFGDLGESVGLNGLRRRECRWCSCAAWWAIDRFIGRRRCPPCRDRTRCPSVDMGLLAAESTSTATLISPIRTVGLYQSDVQHLYLPVSPSLCETGETDKPGTGRRLRNRLLARLSRTYEHMGSEGKTAFRVRAAWLGHAYR